ncbi:PREDICTED: myeloid differentiation primary response protein MyD88 [Dufourea novaeangliae]|uniref:myeloid differentiation primary response protein MyD88 n=1 Tax=Dufourea novaeangliae TaxID=178035 RepID=UPI0007671441|nr:PREDICTED: myeloid differentiation primary response protein MyD88 [Dufourea novaeangliae]
MNSLRLNQIERMTADPSTVPLVALSVESKQVVSALLNPPKVIPSENGLPRDWRGFAHLSNLSGELMPLLISQPDPSAYILTFWEQKQKNATIKDFQVILEELDRWDILDDTVELFERDSQTYLSQLERSQTSANVIANEVDEKILTVDDLHRLKQGFENQYYDAFLLYADEDVNFAIEMVDKLENQYNLKLCLKDRDLIGGITFEHEAVMTLISERCNRLIVIISSNFLKSSANKFFLNYAQALGIEKRQRKVIPCLYEKCQLPSQLNYMFILDYNRVGLYDFWGKLRDSVCTLSRTENNTNGNSDRQAVHFEKEKEYNKLEKNETVNIQDRKLLEPLQDPNNHIGNGKDKLKTEESLQSPEDNLNNHKDNNKKYNNFLQWTMRKWTRKSENDKKKYIPITESVSLPSLEGLDTLTIATDSVEKKHKTKFINKYMKRVLVK